ncbi:MAG: hypothetical protein EOP91_09920 [Lysobacteraceae bacterium]|nr:MAG: hypothetical protein EOP91_09920 [Xanthomonadaceae bacterium]
MAGKACHAFASTARSGLTQALGAAMTSLLLIALLLAGTEAQSAHSAVPIDCKAERVALLQSIQPLVIPDATLATPPDNDPRTVQFFIISGAAANSGSVSKDGQVIYLPASAADGPDADDTIGAQLFAQATDRLLSLKFGDVCAPLQIPSGGS